MNIYEYEPHARPRHRLFVSRHLLFYLYHLPARHDGAHFHISYGFTNGSSPVWFCL